MRLESFKDNLQDVLEQSGPNEAETRSIMDEVRAGYPWLDEIYQEQGVKRPHASVDGEVANGPLARPDDGLSHQGSNRPPTRYGLLQQSPI
jgi:hypothetical protein